MKQRLLEHLCDPNDLSDLDLISPEYNETGDIIKGDLVSKKSGKSYPIINGVPRFVPLAKDETVESFGDQWNYFNFDSHKLNWENQSIKNTFGGLEVFKGKIVVDAGAGSGSQSKWISEAGAEYVIALELSHAVDGVIKENLKGLTNVDIVQCSIDKVPLKSRSIEGIVICHNVIQHTESVEKTAHDLWRLVGKDGEFVFNCYPKNDQGLVRYIRYHLYLWVRSFLVKRSFNFRLNYCQFVSILRFVPVLGTILEKLNLVNRGEVIRGENYLRRLYTSSVVNTFDGFGSHTYQHTKTDEEIKKLLQELQTDRSKVRNFEKYFTRPMPVGIALRVFR